MNNITANNVATFNCDRTDICNVTVNCDTRYVGNVSVVGGAP